MSLKAIRYISVNCSDYGRSLAFYTQLGFEVVHEFANGGDPLTRPMLGLPADLRSRSCLLSLDAANPAAPVLDLVQWFDGKAGNAAAPDMTAPGYGRLAIHVDDIHAEYRRLLQAGMSFISPPGQSARGTWLCCLRDPDGAAVQLMQPASLR